MKSVIPQRDNKGDPLFDLNDVSYSFLNEKGGQTEVFRPLSFAIKRGEFITLLGPSGCGKSTLLRLLADLLSPTSGELRRIGLEKNLPFGFVFQEPHLMPWKTVAENIALPLSLMQKPKGSWVSKYKSRVLEVLTQVELEKVSGFYPRQLSGGMKMRTALARALVFQPEVLFLDEPFAALDERLRFDLGYFLRSLWLQRKKSENPLTVIMVTHSVSEAVWWSDRILVMGDKPRGILGEIVVPLEQERPREMNETAPFHEALRSVYAKVRNEKFRV